MGVGLCRRLRPNMQTEDVTGSLLTGISEVQQVGSEGVQHAQGLDAKTSLLVFIAKPQSVACEARQHLQTDYFTTLKMCCFCLAGRPIRSK